MKKPNKNDYLKTLQLFSAYELLCMAIESRYRSEVCDDCKIDLVQKIMELVEEWEDVNNLNNWKI